MPWLPSPRIAMRGATVRCLETTAVNGAVATWTAVVAFAVCQVLTIIDAADACEASMTNGPPRYAWLLMTTPDLKSTALAVISDSKVPVAALTTAFCGLMTHETGIPARS